MELPEERNRAHVSGGDVEKAAQAPPSLIGSTKVTPTRWADHHASIYVRDMEKRAQYLDDCHFFGWHTCPMDESWWDYVHKLRIQVEKGLLDSKEASEIFHNSAISVVLIHHHGNINLRPRYDKRGRKQKPVPVIKKYVCNSCNQEIDFGEKGTSFQGRDFRILHFHKKCWDGGDKHRFF